MKKPLARYPDHEMPAVKGSWKTVQTKPNQKHKIQHNEMGGVKPAPAKRFCKWACF